MILQIDVGNTNAKWRFISEGVCIKRGASILSVLIPDVQSFINGDGLKASALVVQLASVVSGPEMDDMRESLHRLTSQVSIFEADSAGDWPNVSFAYGKPETQGVDRCLAMLSAFSIFYQRRSEFDGVMVIDAGSALTVDVLDQHGRQVQGYIMPGYAMMRSSLLNKTASINSGYIAGRAGKGLSTESCVEDGVAMAFYSALSASVSMASDKNHLVVITGGDARRCKTVLADGVLFEPDLVFDGLAQLFAAKRLEE